MWYTWPRSPQTNDAMLFTKRSWSRSPERLTTLLENSSYLRRLWFLSPLSLVTSMFRVKTAACFPIWIWYINNVDTTAIVWAAHLIPINLLMQYVRICGTCSLILVEVGEVAGQALTIIWLRRHALAAMCRLLTCFRFYTNAFNIEYRQYWQTTVYHLACKHQAAHNPDTFKNLLSKNTQVQCHLTWWFYSQHHKICVSWIWLYCHQ